VPEIDTKQKLVNGYIGRIKHNERTIKEVVREWWFRRVYMESIRRKRQLLQDIKREFLDGVETEPEEFRKRTLKAFGRYAEIWKTFYKYGKVGNNELRSEESE
jgi:hypothetical protein